MDRKLHRIVPLLLAAVACARGDVDVARLVAVRPPGTLPRVTFAGIGVGASRDAAVAAFGDGLGFPGDGAYLGTIRRDEGGTRLEVLWNVRGGRVDVLSLTYRGSRAGLREVERQWRAILAAAGADCGDGACYLDEGDVAVARVLVGESHEGPEVGVTIQR